MTSFNIKYQHMPPDSFFVFIFGQGGLQGNITAIW